MERLICIIKALPFPAGPLLCKFQFAAQCAVTLRARCGGYRYSLTRLGNVIAIVKFQLCIRIRKLLRSDGF